MVHLGDILQGTEIFLVDVKVDNSNRILVHVDKNEGISIDNCVRVSRELEGKLDRDREDFALEVSSPGLDAPFKVFEQYIKSIGKMVSVQSLEGDEYLGLLKDVNEDRILLELAPEKKGAEPEQQELLFNDIRSTKIHIQF